MSQKPPNTKSQLFAVIMRAVKLFEMMTRRLCVAMVARRPTAARALLVQLEQAIRLHWKRPEPG